MFSDSTMCFQSNRSMPTFSGRILTSIHGALYFKPSGVNNDIIMSVKYRFAMISFSAMLFSLFM